MRGRTPEGANRSGLAVLVVHGGEDHTVPREMAEEIAGACGERSRLLIIPEAKHALCYLTDPAAYAAALGKFIDGTA